MYSDVQTYTALGPHRSGSAADAATVAWLRASLPAQWHSFEEEFRIAPWFDYQGCTLVINGALVLPCFGVWFPNATVAEDLRVVSGLAGIHHARRRGTGWKVAAIVDISSPTLGSHAAGDSVRAVIDAGASAVLVVNHLVDADSTPSHSVAINAPPPFSTSAWPVPVALVSTTTRAMLLATSETVVTRLHVRGSVGSSKASNLLATLRVGGTPSPSPSATPRWPLAASTADPLAPPTAAAPPPPSPSSPHPSPRPIRLIISTPTSGWHACGGERGPGVAVLLMLARRLPSLLEAIRADAADTADAATRRLRRGEAHAVGGEARAVGAPKLPMTVPPIEVLLLATTLHELGHQGASGALRTAPALGFSPHETDLWLALGASIITRRGGASRADAGGGDEAADKHPFTATLDYTHGRLGAAVAPYVDIGFTPRLEAPHRRGELVQIAESGYAAVGFYGEHSLFHTPLDGANTTSAPLLARVAQPTLSMLAAVVTDAIHASQQAGAAVGIDAPTRNGGATGSLCLLGLQLYLVLGLWWWAMPPLRRAVRCGHTSEAGLL
jgi:hypothetical protein